VTDATARILIDNIDEFANAVFAIADYPAWRAPSGGNEFAIDNQQTMIVAMQIRLDDD
jgi:hypothetical protein